MISPETKTVSQSRKSNRKAGKKNDYYRKQTGDTDTFLYRL
jgi:hypothetical protein